MAADPRVISGFFGSVLNTGKSPLYHSRQPFEARQGAGAKNP
jgi:hypothetical protein